MAFGKGNESTEGAKVVRYTGVASVYVKCVNPSKDELEKFYGRDVENAPEYVGEIDVNGTKVPQVRLDFMVVADPEKYTDGEGKPIDFKTRVSLFLRKEYRLSSAGKYQVIDKYGRTAWATEAEIAAKQIPVYSNGKPANIDADYRKAYHGEEELIKFLIAYLNIPSCQKYVNGEWVMLEANKLADCEASLEHIDDYFKGNFKELSDILALQPNNKVKVLFGVRNTDDGKQYQTAYTRMFLKNSVTDYSRIDKDLQEAKNNGAMPTSEFEVSDLHEYVVAPTNFSGNDAPFPPASSAATPWG